MQRPPFKNLAFLHIAHALESLLHWWQSFAFAMHVGAPSPPSSASVLCSHRLLKFPFPTLLVPAGHAAMQAPACKKAAFLQTAHALESAVQAWQSLALATQSGAPAVVGASVTVDVVVGASVTTVVADSNFGAQSLVSVP